MDKAHYLWAVFFLIYIVRINIALEIFMGIEACLKATFSPTPGYL
ncbi:MAG TPA: hypothetical protein VNL13_02645 [Sulfolobales archaeon]|nr:hypothetical protein [Sulfolobales archaeon]